MSDDAHMRNVHEFDWSNGATIDQAKEMISYLVDKLQQAMTNPLLHAEVQGQLHALNSSHSEKGPERPLVEGSKGGAPSRMVDEEEEEVLLLQKGPTHHDDSTKKNGGNDTFSSLDSDVAPRRKRVKRSPTPPKRKRLSFHSPQNENMEEEAATPTRRRRGRGHHPLPLLHHHHHHHPLNPYPRKAPSLPHPQGREEAIEGAMHHGDALGGSRDSRREESSSLSSPMMAHMET